MKMEMMTLTTIMRIVPITKRTSNNSSYIGALELATRGNKSTLFPTHMPPMIRQMLTRKEMMDVFESNIIIYLYLKVIKNQCVAHAQKCDFS